jgi:hypothetical protein
MVARLATGTRERSWRGGVVVRRARCGGAAWRDTPTAHVAPALAAHRAAQLDTARGGAAAAVSALFP